MHRFPNKLSFSIPERFNNPFRYDPHPLVRAAAEIVISRLRKTSSSEEGKMLGVLIVKNKEGEIGYLAGFSGLIDGKSILEGFVPPIYDLQDPKGNFKSKEAEISDINRKILKLEETAELKETEEKIREAQKMMSHELEELKVQMAIDKNTRAAIRSEEEDPNILASLIKESQHQKAELRRLKKLWEGRIIELEKQCNVIKEEIKVLKKTRAEKSDSLQKWIFQQYKVLNAKGEEASISEIFSSQGLTAPGGTGECAAPKLLNYAYRNGMKPLAMGEFWYGKASETAVRCHGHFYPSCTSKCGPLLTFMLKGLEYEEFGTNTYGEPKVLHEDDDIIIVSKPSGMPSVPGMDGRKSLLEWLDSINIEQKFISVHRLDMDTSGIMIFAKNDSAALSLRKQFECHSIEKKYIAHISASDSESKESDSGRISLPLSPDYDERPRQKLDYQQGKEAITEYQICQEYPDGSAEVIFRPITGRTHQLRVHSAHQRGLGRAIAGDLLYGGQKAERLMLHAYSISFTHPQSQQEMHFETTINCF